MSDKSVKAIVVFDIDGVVRDVSGSYRRALADTVEHLTQGHYRPSQSDIDTLKAEGCWNNDWRASEELVYRYYSDQGRSRNEIDVNYDQLVAFFQQRYRGSDSEEFTGYITDEPLLMGQNYLNELTAAQFKWGFFSGATQASARYVLERRLQLQQPTLVAMEDAPDKPNPTGLFQVVQQLEDQATSSLAVPVIYAGDTVADMQTIKHAREQQPQRHWIGVGVIPPHAQKEPAQLRHYQAVLETAGAKHVVKNVEELVADVINQLLTTI